MSKKSSVPLMRKSAVAVSILFALSSVAGCSSDSDGGAGQSSTGGDTGDVVIEFQQWWEPELPDGDLRSLMDEFEQQNPGIKVELVSAPFAATKEQLIAGMSSGTLADVMGLDGNWINEMVSSNAIADLGILADDGGFDRSQLVSEIKLDDVTYAIPIVNNASRLYANMDLLEQAGIKDIPKTWSEFESASKKISDLGPDISGWAMPMALDTPSSVQNDITSWLWTSGGSFLKDGKPDVANPDVESTMKFLKGLWDKDVISPGSFTQREQDKIEEFINGRIGFIISPLVHSLEIGSSNPDLNFKTTEIPVADDFSGTPGAVYTFWGIGIAESSPNKAEAWKLVEFLLGEEANAKLAGYANGFPGNKNAVPEQVASDEAFSDAMDSWLKSDPVNEFTALPVAEELERIYLQEMQRYLSDEQDLDATLQTIQSKWEEEFK